jgi:hypothetical protein
MKALALTAVLLMSVGCGSGPKSHPRGTPKKVPPRITVAKWSDTQGKYVETVHEGWPTVTEERDK